LCSRVAMAAGELRPQPFSLSHAPIAIATCTTTSTSSDSPASAPQPSRRTTRRPPPPACPPPGRLCMWPARFVPQWSMAGRPASAHDPPKAPHQLPCRRCALLGPEQEAPASPLFFWATRDLVLKYETTQGSRCEAKTHMNSASGLQLISRNSRVPEAKVFSFIFSLCRFLDEL
jgi:hypothetical protein